MVVNIKTIKVSLADEYFDDLIKKINYLKTGLEAANKAVVKEMARTVRQDVSNNLAATPY